MPFSVYGDGIKKILYILNKLFDATDSILLIDEIETGLHKKYYDTLFSVVFALASKLNVQLFIATHSIEAIDAILRYGNYENNNSNIDPIKVITLKKVDSNNGNGKFAHFVEQHRVNNMITEQDISSLMVVTDRDEASDAKIGRVINNSFENISTKAGQWINNSITDSYLKLPGQNQNL